MSGAASPSNVLAEAAEQARLGNVVGALEQIGARWPPADAEERFHLERLAAWLAERVEAHQAPATLAERLSLPSRALAALRRPRHAAPPRPGVALVPLLDTASGRAFIARARVERCSSRSPSSQRVGEGWRRARERAEEALWRIVARGPIAPTRVGEGLRWQLEAPSGLERVDGGSAAGALVVAAFSLLSDRPVPPDVAVCATLDEELELGPVGGLSAKLEALSREEPRVRRVVVAEGSSAREHLLVSAKDGAELLARVFGDEAVAEAPDDAINLEGTLARALALYLKEGEVRAAAILLERVLALIASRRARRDDEALYRREEVIARWRAAAARTQLGDVARATAHIRRAQPLAEALWREGALDAASFLGFEGTCALALRDAFRYDEAEALLEACLKEQRSLRVGKRELARTLGNLGELRTFAGRLEGAAAALHEALAYLEEVYTDEVPRLLCYLGNLELARGDPDAAHARFDEGLRRNARVETAAATNDAFLRYGKVRAAFASGRLDEVEELATAALETMERRAPYPLEMIRVLRGRARLARGAVGAGHADLAATARSAPAEAPLLRFGLSMAHLHRARHWLDEAGLPQLEAITSACARLGEAMASLVAFPDRDELQAALRDLTARLPASAVDLAALLARIHERYPY